MTYLRTNAVSGVFLPTYRTRSSGSTIVWPSVSVLQQGMTVDGFDLFFPARRVLDEKSITMWTRGCSLFCVTIATERYHISNMSTASKVEAAEPC
ncbi:hypothetical protein BKA82DRAFT_1008848 [Pisolithus tinctorius]|uniref:Uncharacterized protein n=1 Tax=Pisolithus tinctorius Marx 270 TaxID=870435 RepID=A0A0C3I911_PISTI|nr:hypothetical protein BKA82DRAFT_1008848 [Pisolithus tinctorius]KIN93602.1 hypothetical protein M404DRAFT_1008848 [Pisolithus tinctorius Marx 270]